MSNIDNLVQWTSALQGIREKLQEDLNDLHAKIGDENSRKILEDQANHFLATFDQIECIEEELCHFRASEEKILHEMDLFLKALRDNNNNNNNSFNVPSPFDSGVSISSLSSGRPIASEEDNQRKTMVQNTLVLPTKNNSSFDSIAGLKNTKQILHQAFVLPKRFPKIFYGVDIKPWTRVLLYGPPGTGKTEMARALAKETGAIFFSVSSADIVSSMVGESEKFIKEIFNQACQLNEPCVIFIDELDSIARVRSSKEEEHSRRIKTELLVQISNLERQSSKEASVALVCATNVPWEIDLGVLRRFQKRIYLPLPNVEARRKLITTQSKSVGATLTDEEINDLALNTEGYSPSDIISFIQDAFYQRVAELESAKRWMFDAGL